MLLQANQYPMPLALPPDLVAKAISALSPTSAASPLRHRFDELYPKQNACFYTDATETYTEGSTKSGKTYGAMKWLVEQVIEHGKPGRKVYWVSPFSKQIVDVYNNFVERYLYGDDIIAKKSPEPEILFKANGTRILFRSGENPQSIYGGEAWALLVDEASRLRDYEIYKMLESLTTYTRGVGAGKARYIGNVWGKNNEFYQRCRKAQDGELPNAEYHRIDANDSVAAGRITQDVLDAKRATMPEDEFLELYYLIPREALHNPFGGEEAIRACNIPLAEGEAVAWGWDPARTPAVSGDITVGIALNARGQVCNVIKWKGVSLSEQQKRILNIVGRQTHVCVDATGLGRQLADYLTDQLYGNAEGIVFTNRSKHVLVTNLAWGIQHKKVAYPTGEITEELISYERSETPSGNPTYSHPVGGHDDHVDALALAFNAYLTLMRGPRGAFQGKSLIH